MSAYTVGHDHIDAMLTLALPSAPEYPGDGRGKTRWAKFDPDTVTWQNQEYREIQPSAHPDDLSEIGRMLIIENRASVSYRYNDSDDLPGTIGEGAANYTYRRVQDPALLVPANGFSIIGCYEYQSCEHPGWAKSEAYRFCEGLKDALIRRLPGFSDALYHYDRPAGVL